MHLLPPSRTHVLVTHADPLLSAGIVSALRGQPGFEIFVNGVDIVNVEGPRIDVIVADYPRALQLLSERSRAGYRALAEARVLVLTANEREADIRRAIEAGVHGYLLVGSPLEELVEAVTLLASGVRYLARPVAQRMADSLARTALTARELEVLRLVVAGCSNKIIARDLRIELATVKTHMGVIMSKLGASTRTQAAAISSARGLVDDRAAA